MKNLTLENLAICGFKTIKEPAAMEFAEGLNAVLVSTDYAIPCGHWDLFDAIRWLFGLQMQHGRKIIFDENIDVAQVVAVIGEDKKEIVISRRFFKNGKDEQLMESEPNAVSLGGNTDTMACIAGSIAEAFYQNSPEGISPELKAQCREILSSTKHDEFLAVIDRFEKTQKVFS